MPKIDRDAVLHVATLSRLALSEDELQLFQDQLSRIIEYFDKLDPIDTAHVQPLSHPMGIRNVFRQDAVGASAPRQDALSNAPAKTDEAYKVPVVVDPS